jgi:DNA (cytosine-5)-methyltransferase 1
MKNNEVVSVRHTVASFFGGVGGIDLGFESTKKFNSVYINEFDKNAQITIATNFDEEIIDKRDIHDVDPTDVPKTDIIVGGFPCQAFSIAGYRKGFEDDRGDLFFELLRMIKVNKPKVIFIENVKNMVSHDRGNTFKVIREALVLNNYYIKWKVLNAKDYGNIPQNRERIYIVGFLEKNAFEAFEFPEKIVLKTKLSDVIDYSELKDDKYYYKKGRQNFYDELEKEVNSYDSVYQWRRQYVRENKSGVVPTLTANMGTGGHNVPIIKTKKGIRKLTPRETFNVQGFPETFKLPNISNGQLYKQAGNSVVVPVIERIAKKIDKALEKSTGNIDLLPPDTYSQIYVKMNGQFEGQSFVKAQISEIPESSEIPILSDEEYLKSIKKKGWREFYSFMEN